MVSLFNSSCPVWKTYFKSIYRQKISHFNRPNPKQKFNSRTKNIFQKYLSKKCKKNSLIPTQKFNLRTQKLPLFHKYLTLILFLLDKKKHRSDKCPPDKISKRTTTILTKKEDRKRAFVHLMEHEEERLQGKK